MKRALLVVDVQKVYTDPDSEMYCPDADSTVANINSLIKSFKKSGEPVIYVRHVHKVDGTDLGRMFDFAGDEVEDFNFKEGTAEVEYDDRLTRLPKSREVRKTRYSAFVGTELPAILKSLGINRVVVCGFMTNFCCESTARDAHDRDFYVDFVTDATGTPGTENMDQDQIRETVGELLGEGFACIAETQEFLS